MTSNGSETPPDAQPTPAISPPAAGPKPVWPKVWSVAQLVVALSGTLAFLAYLLFVPNAPPPAEPVAPVAAAAVAEVIGPGLIRVQSGGPLDKKIVAVAVQKKVVRDAVLTVTGRVAASRRPGSGKAIDATRQLATALAAGATSNRPLVAASLWISLQTPPPDYWQFDTPEVLTAYTDWKKAQAEIAFIELQLGTVRRLADARLVAQKQVLARAEKAASIGDGTAKEVAVERANLIQTELAGITSIHESETALGNALRAEAAAAKQLQQAGLDPDLLRTATSDMDIVLADVPEGRLNRVKVGQGCQATFSGIPDQRFSGKVTSSAPVLSKERRSLRVLFVVHDPNDQLRPGMFAEIGLGTDPRETLLVPADGVLHIGRADYVLVGTDANVWRVAEVHVGEPQNGEVEVLSGVKAGERVIGQGAILFKPLVVRALQPPRHPEARP